MLGTPRTDPGVRLSRTGLLPWVMTRRHSRACRTRTGTCDRDAPALCPVPGMHRHVPLGQPPSLDPLRPSWRTRVIVRGRLRYYGAVRPPTSVHHGRVPWGFTRRTLAPARAGRGFSRFPCKVPLCMPGVFDPARSGHASPRRHAPCRLPCVRTTSDLEISLLFRGSIPSLHIPLPTLREHRHRCPRMTRGRGGWLALPRRGLTPLTPCRFSSAHP